MLYLILILVFLAFKFLGKSFLVSLRLGCLVALLGFLCFVAQPIYRMEVLGEKPGRAIANAKFLPMAAQFIPYMGVSNLVFGGPGKGTYAGPCVHYSYYQQKLMDLYGVPSTLLTGYGHSALRFVEDGRTYVTDNGLWYQKPVEIGEGNWAPGGSDSLYILNGNPNPLTPYLFPVGMMMVICLSYMLEMAIFSRSSIAVPFRSRGMIKILPEMVECSYRKAGNCVLIERDSGTLRLEASEVKVLEDAPDMFFHREVGHFQLVR